MSSMDSTSSSPETVVSDIVNQEEREDSQSPFHHPSCGSQFSSTIISPKNQGDRDTRSLEESLVASALLDLASASDDNKSNLINGHLKASHLTVNGSTSQLLPSHVLMKSDGTVAGTVSMKNSLQGQRVIHLQNGIELLLASSSSSSSKPVSSHASSPINSIPSSVIVPNHRYALVQGAVNRPKPRVEETSNCVTDGNNNVSSNLTTSSHLVMIPSNRVTGIPTSVIDNNIYHFVSTSNGKNCMEGDDLRRILPGSPSLFASSMYQTNALSNATNGLNTLSPGMKKRGRKKLYSDQCSSDGSASNNESSSSQSRSNPIKEFRQRQRTRERLEDERLFSLEQRYLKTRFPDMPQTLDELYDSRGLNIKFPRVKTLFKRGKASDDNERSNRKKECARRDSKNYRERAKAKRDLVVKKIHFLEDLFTRATIAKYQFVFK